VIDFSYAINALSRLERPVRTVRTYRGHWATSVRLETGRQCKNMRLTRTFSGADDGIRTRDLHLGKKKNLPGNPQLPYLHLCKLMQHDRRFRLTTANRY